MMESPEQSSDLADSVEDDDYRLGVCSLPHDLDAAATLLAHVAGLNPIDAKTRLRHVPGVWPDKLTRQAAETAARGLEALEMSVVAVPAANVPDLHPGQLVHHVQCTDEGIRRRPDQREPEPPLDWSRLALLSVANVAVLNRKRPATCQTASFVMRRGSPRHDVRRTITGWRCGCSVSPRFKPFGLTPRR